MSPAEKVVGLAVLFKLSPDDDCKLIGRMFDVADSEAPPPILKIVEALLFIVCAIIPP